MSISEGSEEGQYGEKDRARHAEKGHHHGVEEAPVHVHQMEGIEKEIEHAPGDDIAQKRRDRAADEFHEEQHEPCGEKKEKDEKRQAESGNGCHENPSLHERLYFLFLLYRTMRARPNYLLIHLNR